MLLKELFRRLVETAGGAELTDHLGYEKDDRTGRGSGTSCNGTTPKTLKTALSEVRVDMPPDRNSTFEPELVEKGQTHWDGFDGKIIAMYAGGMTVEEIRCHLERDLRDQRAQGLHFDGHGEGPRRRPGLPARRLLPRVWIDALVKVWVDGVVRNRRAHLALGLIMERARRKRWRWSWATATDRPTSKSSTPAADHDGPSTVVAIAGQSGSAREAWQARAGARPHPLLRLRDPATPQRPRRDVSPRPRTAELVAQPQIAPPALAPKPGRPTERILYEITLAEQGAEEWPTRRRTALVPNNLIGRRPY